jgi:hypothetical protein
MKESDIPLIENELLEYINKETNHTEDRPAGFGITSSEYAASSGRAFTTARRMLQQLVKVGKLQSKQMIENRHIVTVYYK